MTEGISDVKHPEDTVSRHLALHLQTLQDDIDRWLLQSYRLSIKRDTPEYDAIQHANVEMFLEEARREKKMFSWAQRVHRSLLIIGSYIMRTMTPLQLNLYLICAYPLCAGGRRLKLEEEIHFDFFSEEDCPRFVLSEFCETPLYFIDRQAEPGEEEYYKKY